MENLLFTHEFGLSLSLHFKAVRRKLLGRKEREGEKRKGNKRKEKEKERGKKRNSKPAARSLSHLVSCESAQSENCPIRTELLCSSTKQADVFMDTLDENRH